MIKKEVPVTQLMIFSVRIEFLRKTAKNTQKMSVTGKMRVNMGVLLTLCVMYDNSTSAGISIRAERMAP